MKFEPGKIHKTFQTKSGYSCSIRWARTDDVANLRNFINQIAEEDTYVAVSPNDTMTLEQEQKFVDDALQKGASKQGSFVVAEISGKIIGTTSINPDEHGRKRSTHVVIFGISILEKYRGEGIGNELTKIALDHAKNFLQNIRMVRLTAFAENTPAITLYKKYGFREVGHVPGAYFRQGKYSDEVTMIKELV